MRIAVIGAGPAGITAAYKLSGEIKSGKVTQLDVYEISSHIGGLSKSLEMWEQVVEKDYDIVNRQTRIFYKNTFFDYPIQASNALRGLGFFEAVLCVLSYLKQLAFPYKTTDTFESWVSNRFGKRLYRIFFKTYSEKLWGIRCDELDSDFASQRIKKLSLFEAVKNALLQGKGNKHATLVDQFAYPLKGTGSVYMKMAEKIKANGGSIHLNTGVEKVLTSGRVITGLELNNGKVIEYDRVISSMPLSLLVTRLPETPYDIKELAQSLKFRNTVLVYLNVDKNDLFDDQWLYIHSADLKMGRITNFRNWVPELYGNKTESIICIEYWCNFEDPEWQLDDESYIALGTEELLKTGLIGDGKILAGKVVRIPRCYPVYFKGYREKLKPIEDYLDTIENLQVIGRYGAYKYNNQDHSILMGILAAENIFSPVKNELWKINTDYEVYQESSVITKTGLVNSAEKSDFE